ncbi:Nif3-like dinuclear metal center hexameric protein [Microbulbifer thermotolerans]|uniref:NGG1p interacting factor NIF3 n=1 Tax=Microbulbifer thermotolerans TaxID=252514 RepID=A0A143HNG0_MICTH|nr:YqfO family protein [Microbulbifer thermotolerans]AMX02970.1 NGG1p interacting factor NIF3 [Microbulbifer thermotolerans]MCX2779897.1 YqfO family protein [Microbulbifer thermotolerans]MCX2781584.1 YqfO family protein [Microbulbifer thermotolerans]MCX2794742.1 YqfO family protein [Microbulbifer thermotolerans]MCX2802779.1 YqfO family protein [Microbulbifer thermotolerans]
MYKLCVYIPESHLEVVKQALFAAGAGRIGDYDHCCWQVKGCGQFRPLDGSQPYIGQTGEVEQVTEYRVEMVCADDLVDAALAALRQAHPYEEPAFDLWRLDERCG